MAVSLDLGIKALAEAIAAKINGLRPKIQVPIYMDTAVNNTYTCTLADAGKQFIWNGGSDLTFVVPDSLPDGFNIKISQFAAGRVLINPGTKTYFANGTAPGLILPGQSAQLDVATVIAGGNSVRILNVSLDQPLPTFYAANATAAVRNSTAFSAIPNMSLTMDANSVYDIDFKASFTSVITSNTIKLGLTALPTGAQCQLEGVIYNTNMLGTSNTQRKTMLNSAEAVAGIAGSAMSSISGVFLAKIFGRIVTGSAGGPVAITMGAIAATGNVSVAAGAATLTAKKFQ